MNNGRAIRVRFEESTICAYEDTDFLRKAPQCGKINYSVNEEFAPDNISIPHLSFQIENEPVAPIISHRDSPIAPPISYVYYLEQDVPPPRADDSYHIKGATTDRTVDRFQASRKTQFTNKRYLGVQEEESGRPVLSSIDEEKGGTRLFKEGEQQPVKTAQGIKTKAKKSYGEISEFEAGQLTELQLADLIANDYTRTLEPRKLLKIDDKAGAFFLDDDGAGVFGRPAPAVDDGAGVGFDRPTRLKPPPQDKISSKRAGKMKMKPQIVEQELITLKQQLVLPDIPKSMTTIETFNKIFDKMIDAHKINGFEIPKAPQGMNDIDAKKFIMDEIIKEYEISKTEIIKGQGTQYEKVLQPKEALELIKKAYDKVIVEEPSRIDYKQSQPTRQPAERPTTTIELMEGFGTNPIIPDVIPQLNPIPEAPRPAIIETPSAPINIDITNAINTLMNVPIEQPQTSQAGSSSDPIRKPIRSTVPIDVELTPVTDQSALARQTQIDDLMNDPFDFANDQPFAGLDEFKTSTKSTKKIGKARANQITEDTNMTTLDSRHSSVLELNRLTNDAMANKAKGTGRRQVVELLIDDLNVVELTDLNIGKFSIDPMAPIVEIKTRTQLPNSIVKKIPTINFPRELGVVRMPLPPIEHFKAGSNTYEFELAQYKKAMLSLKSKIKASNLHGQDKIILEKQMDLITEYTKIQNQKYFNEKVGFPDITDDARVRQIEIEQNFYKLLLETPISQRPNLSMSGELGHDGLPMIDRAEMFRASGIKTLTDLEAHLTKVNVGIEKQPNKIIMPSVAELDLALSSVASEFHKIVTQFPEIQDINTSNIFKVTTKIQLTNMEYMSRMIKINPIELTISSTGAAVGILGGMIVGDYLQKTGLFTGMIGATMIGALAGGVGGALGAMTSEALIASTASRFGAIAMPQVAEETALITTARAAVLSNKAIFRAAAEGLVIGAALVPLDMALRDFLLKNGYTHQEAGAITGATVATVGATIAGIGQAISVIGEGVALAPETAGMSLLLAISSVAISSGMGAYFGLVEDNDARDDRNAMLDNKKLIIKHMAENDYDVDKTIEFVQKKYNIPDNRGTSVLDNTLTSGLNTFFDPDSWFSSWTDPESYNPMAGDKPIGMGKPTWSYDTYTYEDTYGWNEFVNMLKTTYSGNTYVHPVMEGEKKPSEDDIKSGLLMERMVQMEIKARAITYGNTPPHTYEDVKGIIESIPDQGITQQERDYLDKKTNRTWVRDIQFQGDLRFDLTVHTQVKIQEAHLAMLNQWDTYQNGDVPDDIRDWANRDKNWEKFYLDTIEIDAQTRIIENYQLNGKSLFENTPSIVRAATRDPNFRQVFETYETEMNATAERYHISREQLLTLQSMTNYSERTIAFQRFQFETLKLNTETVDEAIQMYEFMFNIASQGFYDKDQFMFAEDPDTIEGWNPMDSQIFQSHELGMTLRQYMDYLHELGQGEAGSINNLPEYTPEEISQQRADDYEHFESYLRRTGHDYEYDYDPETGRFKYNVGTYSEVIENDRERFRTSRPLIYDPFLPEDYVSTTDNFAKMTHGMNEHNQKQNDDYNIELHRTVNDYANEYDRLVADYNAQAFRTGGEYLYFDAQGEYEAHRVTYIPKSENINDYHFTGGDPVQSLGRPPKFGRDQNMYVLLIDEWRDKADALIQQTRDDYGGRELTFDEINYISKNIFAQQYFESQAEQLYWSEREQRNTERDEKTAIATEGIGLDSTDLQRATNMKMTLDQYYTWVNTYSNDFQTVENNPDDEKDTIELTKEEKFAIRQKAEDDYFDRRSKIRYTLTGAERREADENMYNNVEGQGYGQFPQFTPDYYNNYYQDAD